MSGEEVMLSIDVAQRVTPTGVRLRTAATTPEAEAERFRALMDGELGNAYRLAAVILRDPVEAEDAVHDAALAAWHGWSRLRDPGSAAAWFHRIVVNECRDRLRKRKRWSLLTSPGHDSAEAAPSEDHVEISLQRVALRGALKSLSTDERICVAMRYGLDLTVPTLAQALDVPEGTVKSRLHSAIKKLRAALPEGPI